MMSYTQKQLEKEWNRRNKAEKESQLKKINIYKLKDGTYTDNIPEQLPNIRWFIIISIILGVISSIFLY